MGRARELPALPESTGTRDALHAYSRVLGGLRRQLTPAHPRWWHASLRVGRGELTTGPIPVTGREGRNRHQVPSDVSAETRSGAPDRS
jgi:hypothetical protein